jgi:glycosyltransferase involved in cell wall biosynthesis
VKTSVIVTSYNYETYVVAAVESALCQTKQPDEIIIVDDGSTDNSVELLHERFSGDSRVRIINKKNGGQLSSFNAGVFESTGDIIFFLDSDDIYKKNYIETILNHYKKFKSCDFTYCAFEEFGERSNIVSKFKIDKDVGFSVIDVIYEETWTGGPTSTLSIRKSVLNKFMPLPFEEDWKVCADNCLVWGSSIVGAHKFFIADPLVKYRVHGVNAHKNINRDNAYLFRLKYNSRRLIDHVSQGVNIDKDDIIHHVEYEVFSSSSKPTPSKLWKYIRIILKSSQETFFKIDKIFKVVKIYLKTN